MQKAVFISNADATIVMATHTIIASKFMALESSSWLFTGFMLASTATQTTFGQLSEIFGRKPLILVSYFVFGLGWYVYLADHVVLTTMDQALPIRGFRLTYKMYTASSRESTSEECLT